MEEPKNSPIKTLLTHEPANLFITLTNKPTITLNDRARKQKTTISSRQPFQKQKKSVEATLRDNITENPQFLFNLTYKVEENINHW